MARQDFRAKLRKAAVQPHKIPGYLKRQVDRILNTVEGSRVVWPGPGRALLAPFQARRPGEDEILVLTHATLVSAGTERAMFARLPNTNVQFPFYPGYSGAGEVLMVGDKVTRFKVGDRVSAGFPHASLWVLREGQATPIPQGVTMEQACFRQLGVIALQGVRKAQIQLGESVAVLGPGLIGQIVIQLVATAGAYPITVVASSARRLSLAMEHGAHATLNLAEEHGAEEHGAEEHGAVEHGAGGHRAGREALDSIQADVTIDVTGNPEAIHDAIRCTRPGGRIVLLGSNRGITHSLDVDRIRKAGLTLIGAHIMSLPQADRSPGWWLECQESETILKLMADGRLSVDRLLTEAVYPSEPELFYRRLVQGDASILGAIFRWDWLPGAQRFAAPRREALEKGRIFQAVWGAKGSADVRRRPATLKGEGQGAAQGAAQRALSPHQVSGHLRVGLIGCGEIAVANGMAVQGATNASIAMVMDVNAAVAEDMAKRYRVPYATNVDELLGHDDVDAVLISVPHYLHAPLTIQAARHGKHVMVEKPMATSLADADAMLEACQKAGVKLSIIYCQRYLPYVQKARMLIEQGALGRLLGINLIHYLDKPVSYWTGGRTGRVATDWRLSKEQSGGGILVFNLVHYLDMIRYLTGLEVTRVYSELGAFDSPVETEDTISISLRYGNPQDGQASPLIGNITAASCVRGAALAHQQLRIWGTEGQLIVGEPFQFYSLHRVEDYNPGEWHTLAEWEWGIERREYVQDFATAVLRDAELAVDGHDGRAVQAIVDAVYASQELKRPVEVEATEI